MPACVCLVRWSHPPGTSAPCAAFPLTLTSSCIRTDTFLPALRIRTVTFGVGIFLFGLTRPSGKGWFLLSGSPQEDPGTLTELRTWALSLTGVSTAPYTYGSEGIYFQSELVAHFHPCGVVGIACSRQTRDRLVRRGVARPHYDDPALPWVILALDTAEDAQLAWHLLRQAYQVLSPGGRTRSTPAAGRQTRSPFRGDLPDGCPAHPSLQKGEP